MSIINPTAADLVHLRDGMEVAVTVDSAREGGSRVVSELYDVLGTLYAAGWIIRDASGAPGARLTELHSPLPPERASAPVGQRRRSPHGSEEVIRVADGSDYLVWYEYTGTGGKWYFDEDVADWEIIGDKYIPQETAAAVVDTMIRDLWDALGRPEEWGAFSEGTNQWERLMEWARRRPEPEAAPVTDETIEAAARVLCVTEGLSWMCLTHEMRVAYRQTARALADAGLLADAQR